MQCGWSWRRQGLTEQSKNSAEPKGVEGVARVVNTTDDLDLLQEGDILVATGHLRSAYGAICCHKFKPNNQTDDIFHKLLGPNASLSVGQSYKDFYIRKT
jgi:hypothetical protein